MIEPGMTASEAFARICELPRQDYSALFSKACNTLAGCTPPGSSRVVLLDEVAWGDPQHWFFIGDIHGDFFALHTLVEAIRAAEPDFRLAFLGDMVDRGPHSLECILYLIDLAAEFPGRVAWIAGNHDIGVRLDESAGMFSSGVDPAEFAEWLNACDALLPVRRMIGQAFIELVDCLPRAIISPDGLLITHGGFPHSDLQSKAAALTTREETLAWANEASCLQDFTWTRISRYPKKLPNRASTGCSYGYLDFAGFASVISNMAPLNRMITGHDHPAGGFDRHKSWIEHPALTLTGYGFGDDYQCASAWSRAYREQLYLGHGVPDGLPEIVPVAVDRTALATFFARHHEARLPVLPALNSGVVAD
jgi:hypothetical protein